MGNKVVYMTGAPAAGKSTVANYLVGAVPGLQHWEYGARLTEYVRRRGGTTIDQAEIRRKSSKLITPADILKVDEQLLIYVENNRGKFPMIIDSHPVTKEEFGFRVTPFSFEQIKNLAPDEIWHLFTPPAVTVERIGSDAKGRPRITVEEARMHTGLQASVAAAYGIALGKPVYLFDTSTSRDTLMAKLQDRLT